MGGTFPIHIAILTLLSSLASAQPINQSFTVICTYGSGCPGYRPDRIRVFDDRVFNLTPTPSYTSARPPGDEPEYDSRQRAEWIEKCRPLQQQSSAAFRRCFQAERDRNAAEVRRQRESVQRREGTFPPR